MRGYGHVKQASADKAAGERARLLERLPAPRSSRCCRRPNEVPLVYLNRLTAQRGRGLRAGTMPTSKPFLRRMWHCLVLPRAGFSAWLQAKKNEHPGRRLHPVRGDAVPRRDDACHRHSARRRSWSCSSYWKTGDPIYLADRRGAADRRHRCACRASANTAAAVAPPL